MELQIKQFFVIEVARTGEETEGKEAGGNDKGTGSKAEEDETGGNIEDDET